MDLRVVALAALSGTLVDTITGAAYSYANTGRANDVVGDDRSAGVSGTELAISNAGAVVDATTEALNAFSKTNSLKALPDFRMEDKYVAEDLNRVAFLCNNKKVWVEALLRDKVSFSIESQWSSWFGSVFEGVVGFGDTVAQVADFGSIRQPWMERALWQGTTAPSLTIPLSFVTFENGAYDDVYRPVMALLSLVCPRHLEVGAKTDTDPGQVHAIDFYAIPGPQLFKGALGTENSDPVSFRIGRWFYTDFCYITSVAVNFAPTCDANGYPVACDVNVGIRMGTTPVVPNVGEFMPNCFCVDDEAGLEVLLKQGG